MKGKHGADGRSAGKGQFRCRPRHLAMGKIDDVVNKRITNRFES